MKINTILIGIYTTVVVIICTITVNNHVNHLRFIKKLDSLSELRFKKQNNYLDSIILEYNVILERIKPCPVCKAKSYLHQAINDMDNPHWTIDCSDWDSINGFKHNRVMDMWYPSEKEAIREWNKLSK